MDSELHIAVVSQFKTKRKGGGVGELVAMQSITLQGCTQSEAEFKENLKPLHPELAYKTSRELHF